MSRVKPAVPRCAFEQGSGDGLFRKKVVHQGPLLGRSVRPLGRNPSNSGQTSELRNLLKDRARQEVTQGAPGSNSQMIGRGHGLNVLVESLRHP